MINVWFSIPQFDNSNVNNLVPFILHERSLPIPMWPNGTIIEHLSAVETLRGFHKTEWVWKNNRSDPRDPTTGVKTTYCVCQGVWHCTKCEWTLRPIVRAGDFETQKGSTLILENLHSSYPVWPLSECYHISPIFSKTNCQHFSRRLQVNRM